MNNSCHPYPTINRLLNTAHAIEQQADTELGELNLSLAKIGLLRHLIDAGKPLPLTALSERCGCVKSNITQLIDRLEADGLVERVLDSKDRRLILARITASGRQRVTVGLALLANLDQQLARAMKHGPQEISS